MTTKDTQVVIVKDTLPDFKGEAALVRKGDEFYVVSTVNALYTGYETLVFRADEHGEITDWCEVAGGRGLSRERALAELADLA